LSWHLLSVTGHHLENLAGTALAALSAYKEVQSGLHCGLERGFLPEPAQPGTHLRTGELAMRCDKCRRHFAAGGGGRSSRHLRGQHLIFSIEIWSFYSES